MKEHSRYTQEAQDSWRQKFHTLSPLTHTTLKHKQTVDAISDVIRHGENQKANLDDPGFHNPPVIYDPHILSETHPHVCMKNRRTKNEER